MKRKAENLTSSKNDSNFQNSNHSKRLPDISKEGDTLDFGGILASKDLQSHRNKLPGCHKKNKALDYKQYKVLMEKKEINESKMSNGNTTATQKTQNSDQFGEIASKSKMIPLKQHTDENSIERRSFSMVL